MLGWRRFGRSNAAVASVVWRFCGCDNARGTLTISVTDRQYRTAIDGSLGAPAPAGQNKTIIEPKFSVAVMKAAPFEYSRPATIDEACALMAADDGARVIAGGQTLVPMMAMRLARPTRLIDINRIAALSYIRSEGDAIAIGATTRQSVAERDALIAAKLPLLARAIPFIGHAATRARGTVGGSLANADPAAELPLIAVTLDASLSYRAGGETVEVPAREFFIGAMITTLPAGACLVSVRFPVWRGKVGIGFHEVNARRSDFAFVSAAAQVELAGDGTCKRIAIGVGAATDFPMRLASAEKQLTGGRLAEAAVRAAVTQALADIEPLADLHASAQYRRRAAVNLATRAVADAREGAQGRKPHAH
jgi:CO/xanthine dehydrogenase FAD-binding subunit